MVDYRQGLSLDGAVLPPTVVAYRADRIVPRQRLGWNAVVTGYAHPIIDLADIARLSAVLIPWVDVSMDTVVAIEPQIVTDYRLTPNR
jgi:hypothetical protein